MFAAYISILLLVACLPPKSEYRKIIQLEAFTAAEKECVGRHGCRIYYDGSDDEFDYFTIARMNYILPGDTTERLAVKQGFIKLDNRFEFNRNGKKMVLYAESKK